MVNGTVTGYTLRLPPGWIRIPLRTEVESDGAIATVLDARFDLSELRLRDTMRARLGQLVATARRRNGLDAYVPISPPPGLNGGAAFIVSGPHLGPAASRNIVDLPSSAQRDEVPFLDMNGTGSLRRERGSPSASAPGRPAPSIQVVDYFLAIPGQTRRWIVVTLSIVGISRDLDASRDLVHLFDETMTTFRWRESVNLVH